MFDFFKKLFPSEDKSEKFYGSYIQIELTQEAKESNINDEFNKQIVFYRGGNRTNKIIPYSIEDLKAIKIVHPDMPVYEEKLDDDYEMMEEEYFGEVFVR